VAEAFAIFENATTLATAIPKGTTDIQNTGALSESDAQTVLQGLQAIQPTIIHVLNGIVEEKSAFNALPLGGVSAVLKAKINALNTDMTAFENALIAIIPADLQASATAIKTTIDAAFSKTVAAYASA